MIIEEKSYRLINEQKARSKMFEFNVDKQDYPSFSSSLDDLILPTHFAIFKYCLNSFNGLDNKETENDLLHSYEYFESACRDGTFSELEPELRFLGMVSSFILKNFAAAKLLFKTISNNMDDPPVKKITLKFIAYAMGNYDEYLSTGNELDVLVGNFLNGIISFDEFDSRYREYETKYSDFDNFIYYYFFYVILKTFEENRAPNILPVFSNTNLDDWSDYFSRKDSIRLLWKSQKLICECGLLMGKSGLISFPTGTGKTKSIEIIIQSRLLNSNLSNVLIVAPLRALVNEIRSDLKKHFKNAVVNNISDANVNDYDDILDSQNLNIIVLTPEKLLYIIHHKRSFLECFQLLIFDESHMIMENGRGCDYEFLLMFVKNNIMHDQQLILVTAVITNPSDIQSWVFGNGDNSVLVDEKNIFVSNKSIGFYNQNSNWLYFYENKINNLQEDYFIPRFLSTNERTAKDKNSLTIFVSEKVSANGSTVIFIPKRTQFKKLLNKVTELVSSGWSNNDEVIKINSFIKENYGEDSFYYKAACCGYYSHHGNVQNGVRLLLEDSFKKEYIKKLVATSTLSEGVNLPIRNFIICGTYISNESMSISKFKNLYGRAVRPDKYTNGNIISMELTDVNGYYKKNRIINRYKQYIDDESPAKCRSSFDPKNIKKCLLENDIEDSLINRLFKRIEDVETYGDLLQNKSFIEFCDNIYRVLYNDGAISKTIDAVENYLSLIFTDFNETISPKIIETLISISNDTYCSKHLEEKDDIRLINSFFVIVGLHFFSMETRCKALYFTSVCNKKYYEVIFPWMDQQSVTIDFLNSICDSVRDLYYEEVFEKKNDRNPEISKEQFDSFLNEWISGSTIVHIKTKMNDEGWGADIDKIEKMIRDIFDYDFPIFISNVIDSLSIIDGDVIIDGINVKQGCIDELTDMIDKIKYGLPGYLSICFYKNIFQDRLMSMKLFNMILRKDLYYEDLIERLKREKDIVLGNFTSAPEFFYNKLKDALNL